MISRFTLASRLGPSESFVYPEVCLCSKFSEFRVAVNLKFTVYLPTVHKTVALPVDSVAAFLAGRLAADHNWGTTLAKEFEKNFGGDC